MPLYEYKCSDCGHKFEELVQSSTQKIVCPACKSETVEKTFSVFAASTSGGGSSSSSGCGRGGFS